MAFVEELKQGRRGVRFAVPRGFEVSEETERSAMLVDKARGFSLSLGAFTHRLDLLPAHDALLRRDVERHARDLFETCFRSTSPADSKMRPRTDDKAWSPVVEVAPVNLGAARVLRVVHRLWYEPGRETLMGHLLVPLAQGLFEVRVLPPTSRLSGVREAAVADRATAALAGTDPAAFLRGIDQRASDDPALDASFPRHPLSVARKGLRFLLEDAGLEVLDPDVETRPGEVEITAAGFAVTPPPRYRLVEKNPPSPKLASWSRVSFSGTDGIQLLTVSRTGTRLAERNGRKLARIAEDLTRASVPAGAEGVRVSAVALPDERGRSHAETYHAYAKGASRQQSLFRWFTEPDGEVVMVAFGAAMCVPVDELADDAEAVVRSFRRLGAKKWWQIS
ncbi:hypothetical protein [Polyangium jinanense]|uniref:Uncharacterized protein n=1 Tax=Polyangium jinanense TaxID=2829994 RepID=A0A9X4AZ66_9BACT|nr:hypothetical protein [Polyangium jinanense]MDC3960270.1 hypothetical protein [Polyangium jinanense]MDC3988010.1 hypothetical protein [Polyangium jinanense]